MDGIHPEIERLQSDFSEQVRAAFHGGKSDVINGRVIFSLEEWIQEKILTG